MYNLDIILASTVYTHSSNVGACCASADQYHQGCTIHSSYATVSDAICKAACDNDGQCKGYATWSVNGGQFCRLATTISECPYKWSTFDGVLGNLNPGVSCGSSYSGCYVKQTGNLIS